MAGAFGSDFPSIKLEQSDSAPTQEEKYDKIGIDSGLPSPAAQSDEDIYEDAGDLNFSEAIRGVYLARVPKYLWESWSDFDDDQEIQLGTVRLEGGLQDTTRLSLLLSSQAINSSLIPKEYNMQIMNRSSENTYIFTEKDLYGYSQKSSGGVPHPRGKASSSQHAFPRTARHARSVNSPFSGDRGRRVQPYKRTVPKQTALVGQIQTEINCMPIENAQYRQIMDERTKKAMFKPRRETKVVEKIEGHVFAPTNVRPPGRFEAGFTKQTKNVVGKGQHFKAARMAKNELIDLIFDCFKRYNYWPLRSLKKELNQPENWLREVLEPIAHLVRNGPFANCWQLNKTSDEGSYQLVKDEAAPDVEDIESEDIEEEDDETVKMEDVMT